MSRVIAIRNWEEFQHYKDRSAPWIKLYRDLLTSESWVLGTDISRVVQVASMLLAVRYQNATPLNFPLLKRVACLDCNEQQFMDALAHLQRSGFLEIQGVAETGAQPASAALASCTSEERRGEKNREEERPRKRGSRLPDDWKPDESDWQYARSKGLDPNSTAEKFRNYWHAKPGREAVKLDWRKTWQNWCLTEAERKPKFGQPQPPKREREPTPEEIARARADAAAANQQAIARVLPNLKVGAP